VAVALGETRNEIMDEIDLLRERIIKLEAKIEALMALLEARRKPKALAAPPAPTTPPQLRLAKP
jgi:hypothetical protein